MNIHSRLFASLILGLAVAACSDAAGPETEVIPIPEFPLPVDPMDIGVTVQPARAGSARITTMGGVVSATADDGTVYTLTLPANALLFDTTVTITPITTVTGLAVSGGRFIGVRLEPNGLKLYERATLRMQPPEGEQVGVLGFMAHDGHNVHRAPFSVNPTRLEMQVLHFSSAIGSINQGDAAPSPARDPMPDDRAAQLQTVLERFTRAERERLRDGGEPSDDFYQNITKVLRQFWEAEAKNLLAAMLTDCDLYQAKEHIVTTWDKYVQFYGLESDFVSELELVREGLIEALKNCWDELTTPCLEAEDVFDALSIARLLAARDIHGYDVQDPALRCGAWQGTATATGPTVHGPSESLSATVIFEVDSANSQFNSGIIYWRIHSGSLRWELGTGTSTNGCPITAPQQTFTMQPSDGYIIVQPFAATTRYVAGGVVINAIVNGTESCAGHAPRTVQFLVGMWLFTGDYRTQDNPTRLNGSHTFADRSYQWNFTRVGGAPALK